MARYDNILATIGNTPIVKLQKLAPSGRQRVREESSRSIRWVR